MSGFISRAACRGRRPSSFAAYTGFQRPALIARMLKERTVARFVVAPDGYGKTSLVVDYCETMFSWSRTFWVNAQSPCFIRDLDAGDLAAGCLSVDENAALVVIDDLPPLDFERATLLSQDIDLLLSRGCEVIVTCVPSCDMPGAFQSDRIRLAAHDLLLADDELDEARSPDDRLRKPASLVSDAYRVAALVWGGDDGERAAFARRILREELPSDLLLIMGSVLIMRRGSFDDLLEVGAIDKNSIRGLVPDYPHLGFSDDGRRFDAPPLDMAALAAAIKDKLDVLVTRSRFDKREELVGAWADMMLRNGQAERACDAVRLLCPRKSRATWLEGHAFDLVRQACFFPVWRLAKDRGDYVEATKMRLSAIEALCRRMLGDGQGALKCAKRCAFNAQAPEEARVLGALIVARAGAATLIAQVQSVLEDASECADRQPQEPSSPWPLLAKAWNTAIQSPQALFALWEEYRDRHVSPVVLCICASWAFGFLGREDGLQAGGPAVPFNMIPPSIERYVRERLTAVDAQELDFFAASAGLAMEEAHGRGMPYSEGPLDTAVLVGLRQVEMAILAQRRLFDQETRAARARRDDWMATRPDSYLGDPSAPSSLKPQRFVPILSLKLFGRFEVVIGDEPVDQKFFRRQNVRALLVLLAVSQGKEVSREALAQAMWPESPYEIARKNFYTVWAQLRRSLSLPDGTCPYLIRHQFGCSLEQRYLQSDVDRFAEICRELLFEKPDLERWSQLFTEIDRDFSSDLMPAERKNQLIIQARNEYRARLVDALVAATAGIVEAGHPQWGIWYARAAINHDETREDAYVALMRAQIAGNQRTAAMMTFLKCRRVLGDQLGIDPSPEATALYESLLDAE